MKTLKEALFSRRNLKARLAEYKLEDSNGNIVVFKALEEGNLEISYEGFVIEFNSKDVQDFKRAINNKTSIGIYDKTGIFLLEYISYKKLITLHVWGKWILLFIVDIKKFINTNM